MGKFKKPNPGAEEAELEKAFYEVSGMGGKTPSEDPSGASSHIRNKKFAVALVIVAAVLLLVAGSVGGWYYFCYTGDDGLMLPNVHAAGVNLGGMTREEAADALHLTTDSSYSEQAMVLHLPTETVKLRPKDTHVSVDVDAIVEAAYAYGRTGSAAEQRKIRKNAPDQDYTLDLIPFLGLDKDYVQAVMTDLDARYNTKLTQPSVTVTGERPPLEADKVVENPEDQVLILTMGLPESTLDTESLYAMVLDAYNNNSFSIKMDFSITEPEPLDVKAIYKQYCVEPVDASLDKETFEVVPETYGYGFDLDAVERLVKHAKGGETLEIPLSYKLPKVGSEEIEGLLFRDLLGSCNTYQYCDSNRMTNMTLACQAINGYIVNPGEVFSFNGVVGKRTEEKGYKGAGSYAGTETVISIGGGICQVSSTLYYAALRGDLEIVDRHYHIFAPDYIDLGMDATVNWGTLDFQFRNNTNYPIRIEAHSSNGTVKVNLYGTDEKDYYVRMSYNIESTTPYKTVYKELPPDNEDGYKDGEVIQYGHTGYRVNTYQHRYSKATDELISSEHEAYSDYDKRDAVICRIVNPEPEVTEPEPTVPETTQPETQPETTVPETTVPETTLPETTAPAEPPKPEDPGEA